MFYPTLKRAVAGCLLLSLFFHQPVTAAEDVPLSLYKQAAEAYQRTYSTSADRKENLDKAEQLCEKGIALLPQTNILLQGFYLLWSEVKDSKDDLPSAEKLQHKAEVLARQVQGTQSVPYALALNYRARLYCERLKFNPAIATASQAEEILAREVIGKHDERLREGYDDCLRWEMIGFAGLGKEQEALSTIKKFLQTKNLNPTEVTLNMQLAASYAQVGESAYRYGKQDDARAFFEKAIALYHQLQSKSDPGDVPVGTRVLRAPAIPVCGGMLRLAEIYIKSGKVEEGEKLKKEGNDWLDYKKRGL